jgi:WD40 repeat protein
MAILKADILTEVNDNLQTSLTDIDKFIQKTLDDLSEEDLLVGTDATQTLVSGGETLDEPTGFRALIPGGIVLTITSSGSRQTPLQKLPQGHRQYNELRHNDSSTGIPRLFSNFNGKFFMWRPANQAFTSVIEYYKDHPQDVNNIEFADNYKNAIFAGTTFYASLKFNRTSSIGLWAPMYESAKRKRIDAMPRQPRIVRG